MIRVLRDIFLVQRRRSLLKVYGRSVFYPENVFHFAFADAVHAMVEIHRGVAERVDGDNSNPAAAVERAAARHPDQGVIGATGR